MKADLAKILHSNQSYALETLPQGTRHVQVGRRLHVGQLVVVQTVRKSAQDPKESFVLKPLVSVWKKSWQDCHQREREIFSKTLKTLSPHLAVFNKGLGG